MIVMTYTAARVKQEIAKEGILPYPHFFAQNTDLSLGRLLAWLRAKGLFARLLQKSWLLPEHHSEKTPVGAFVLHFLSCLILIFATWGMRPDAAYELLTTLSVYVINCFFGFWVGLGILILRWKGPPETEEVGAGGGKDEEVRQKTAPKPSWSKLTGRRINPYLSVFCASFFTLCNAWPVITTWIPPAMRTMQGATDWYLIPTVAWAVIALGVAWYLGFLAVAGRRERKQHEVFVVEKKPEFESDGRQGGGEGTNGDEGLVLIHETTYLSWVGKETLSHRRADQTMEMNDHAAGGNTFAGTDFDGYFQQPQQPQQPMGYEPQQQPSPVPPQGAFQSQVHPPTPLHHPHQHTQDQFAQSPYQQQGAFQQPRGWTTSSHR